MKLGMLWLDMSKNRTLEEKIDRAASYYQQKFGHSAELCFVHTSTLVAEQHVGSLCVLPAENILPNHFWLGRDTSL